ncbi:hypothetical protein [Dyella ginsengisoli]|uniref:hypothetical protein n=1 Tax=Dyella ginsengisoli TaxID=363848 RepID=UPI0003754336|nr:hypothetical protein [Dyella ginsengisoli]
MKWGKIQDVALIGLLLILGWQALGMVARAIFGEWFRAHEDFCTNVWLVLPFLAYRLKDATWRANLRITAINMELVRNALLAVSVAISIGFFFHQDAGHPANWLESIERWGLTWIYIAMWIAVPWITWFAANHALLQARIEASESRDLNDPA